MEKSTVAEASGSAEESRQPATRWCLSSLLIHPVSNLLLPCGAPVAAPPPALARSASMELPG